MEPHHDYIYEYDSHVLTGIPNLRQQYSGIKIQCSVRAQVQADYSIILQVSITVNMSTAALSQSAPFPGAWPPRDNPTNTKHCITYTMLAQRRRRWAGVVWMLYKCFVFAGKLVYYSAQPKRQYLLTCKVNRFRLLALPGSIRDLWLSRKTIHSGRVLLIMLVSVT